MKPLFEIPVCQNCDPRAHSIFGELNKDDVENLSLHKGCNFHRNGQVLFYEGNHAGGVFCINRGRVKLFKLGEDGRETIVRLAKEGDIIGYRALITGEPYTVSAAVMEDTVVCFIPKNTFLSMLQENATFSNHMIQILCHDSELAERQALSLAQKSVRERVSETLLMIEEFYGYESDGETLKGSLTREDIANIVGAATETVIRTLAELKADGIIDLEKRKIIIQDREALIHAASVYD